MSIQNTYNQSKEEFLFNNSKKFTALRDLLLDKFDFTPKEKKK